MPARSPFLNNPETAGRLSRPAVPLAVVAGMMFTGFFSVMDGVDVMAVRNVRVMAGFLMIAGSVMLGCRTMVLGGFFVVLCGFHMVIRSRFRHG